MNNFSGNTLAMVYFSGGKMYFDLKSRFPVITYQYREKLKSRGMVVNGQEYPWSCSCAYANAILAQNASLLKSAGEVEYQNETPETFLMVQGSHKIFPALTKTCVKEFIRRGTAIEVMQTNCKSDLRVNESNEAVPVISVARIVARGNLEIRTEGDFAGLVQSVLAFAQELIQETTLSNEKRRIEYFASQLEKCLDQKSTGDIID